MRDPEVIEELREMARRGSSVCDMVVYLASKPDIGLTRQLVGSYLRAAFELSIGETAGVYGWSYFPGGTWTQEMVEARVMPAILAAREKWDKEQ
jgi:hypothetical protein